MPKVAVLHTSFVFVSVEPAINDLISELLPEAEVIHFVDSDVLATVIKEQGISPASEVRMTRMAEAAEAAGADIIFSACSSLGPALDVAAEHVSIPVLKIDEPMAVEAVTRASRIGVLATVPTTLAPTSDLLKQKAEELGRDVEVRQQLCEGAFDVLMSGDRQRHDDMVSEQAAGLAEDVELIVLAQASMNRLADRLAEETGIPVLSSPRRGVTELAARVAELSP
jgi:Asp/Glu/hydantoin racemase